MEGTTIPRAQLMQLNKKPEPKEKRTLKKNTVLNIPLGFCFSRS